jgi:hypothetical protein
MIVFAFCKNCWVYLMPCMFNFAHVFLYYRQYLEHNPSGYCNHGIRFKWSDQVAASL